MTRPALRKSLSAPGLLSEVRRCFEAIKDDTVGRGFALVNYLMSGLAVLGLKYPSLLQFDEARADAVVASNLRTLYGIDKVPSDTALRERLDAVDPATLRGGGAVSAGVAVVAAGQEVRCVSRVGGALPVVGGRHGVFLFGPGALRAVLSDTAPGWSGELLSSIAGGGAGAS